ncbi:hypothetical protein ACLGI4_28510 [Streptomyces sp. HMX112]|uniref:hypothetical protein n=1 Tax=Streptomyces sp. HMX112 TaxID=3390850 RepID=UPI003A807DE6
MTHDQHPEVVAVWHTASAAGRYFEELLADGTVHAWTEPPFGETYYPGEDDPDYNPICDCPAVPRRFARAARTAPPADRAHARWSVLNICRVGLLTCGDQFG